MNSPLECSHCWCQRTTVNGIPHKVCCMCSTRRATEPGDQSDNPWRGPFRPLRPDQIRYLQQEPRDWNHPERKVNEIPWFSRGLPIAGRD